MREFIHVQKKIFFNNNSPYRICGANFWHAAMLGRPSNPEGQLQLIQELDQLQTLGINNLRIMGASEGIGPSVLTPAFQPVLGEYNVDVLCGLDLVLVEAAKRDMRVVIFLNNYWDWSGGMPQYLAWANNEPIVPLLGTVTWDKWSQHTASFYQNDKAIQSALNYAKMLVQRVNSISGVAYNNDPTIMAWQLANEPRPGEHPNSEIFSAFKSWITTMAQSIKFLAPRQLISIGAEGFMGGLYDYRLVKELHEIQHIDYVTAHLWPKNWSWFDVYDHALSMLTALEKSRIYIEAHTTLADELNMPLVFEEFGINRDGGDGLALSTQCRDQFFQLMFQLVEDSVRNGRALQGSNFWFWCGTVGDMGLSHHTGRKNRHRAAENGVFAQDLSTLTIIQNHNANLNNA